MKTQQNACATIVGAGLGGIMMAIRLARRGYHVDVYERRPSVTQMHAGQRSFTVTLSKRGLTALDEIGLKEATLAVTIPLSGRMVHARDGSVTYVPYGKDNSEQIYAIRRHDMNAVLYQAAQDYPNIHFHFAQRLTQVDKQAGKLWFQEDGDANGTLREVTAALIIGCDGFSSAVRQQVQRGERCDYHQECLDWGYKDVFIPAGPNNRPLMHVNALHVWPRGHSAFLAFPTVEGTFACNFLTSLQTLESLQTPEMVLAMMQREFPDLLDVAPSMPQQIIAAPTSNFITMYTAPWHYGGKIALVGDAAHAVTPFWGEGMNSAYEDAVALDRMLAQYPDQLDVAFARYQAERKPNTDLLAELSKRNFLELRDTTDSLRVMARKSIENKLYQLWPNQWLPLNIMISHRNMTYRQAAERHERQRRVARWLGMDVAVAVVAAGLAVKHGLRKLTHADQTPQRADAWSATPANQQVKP